jgi:putative oxidoreductase
MEEPMSAVRMPVKAVRSAWSVIDRVDLVIIPFLRRVAVPLLRISLGIVFVWFGLLKVFEVSPVAEFVARTVYWVDPKVFVPALGVFEVTLGVLLLLGRMMRLTLLLFVAQMVGTFLTFLILPNVTFRHGNPLLLTVEGEFVVKNLVLIAAALVVGTTVRRKPGARRRLA